MHSHIYTKEAKASRSLFVTLWIVYILVCFIKSNYTASVAYIVKEGIFTKTNAGIISAAFYLVYGLAQILFGKITDRVSPFTLITVGIIGAIAANIILCFTNKFIWVLIVWTLCGLVQFGVWPATSRIISELIIPEHRQRASAYISLCIGLAGFLSFLLVTFILEAFGWSGVFLLNALVMTASLLLWKYMQSKTEPLLAHNSAAKEKLSFQKSKDVRFVRLFFSSGLVFGFIILMLKTMLDNGIKNWVPTMIMESYSMAPTMASVITALIFICNISGVLLVIRLSSKIKNEYAKMLACFSVSLPALILLQFTGTLPVWLIVVSLILSTSMIYAINNTSVLIANCYSKIGYTGTVASLLNGSASFGVVVASAGYGYLSEHFSWGVVTGLWLVLGILAVILNLMSIKPWNKFKKSQES